MGTAETNYRAWLEKVDEDLLSIDNNLSAARTPWGTVCFHSQQAAEKSLKAFLVYHKRKPRKTHDLALLLTECAEINPEMANLESECDSLTPHGVLPRYPDDFLTPDEEEARSAAFAARRVRDCILALLPPDEA